LIIHNPITVQLALFLNYVYFLLLKQYLFYNFYVCTTPKWLLLQYAAWQATFIIKTNPNLSLCFGKVVYC